MVSDKNNSGSEYDAIPGEEQKTGFAALLGNFDVLRQVILVLALAICIAIAVFIMIWAQEPTFRPLGKMETDQMITTLDYLDTNEIDYRVEGNTVFVPEHQYDDIRLSMTRAGVDYGKEQDGSDLILMDQGFGVSQRME